MRSLECYQREKIMDMQKRFTHLTNHLASLGKTLTNNELNLKILISLPRAWQPKVTAILENKRLENMSLAAHFEKLQEYLERVDWNNMKKHKNISFKAESNVVQQDDSSNKDENIIVLVKKFEKFLQKDKNKNGNKRIFHKKNDDSTSKQNFTCFECGKEGLMKVDCPTLAKKNNH